jgi:hypothetical protein
MAKEAERLYISIMEGDWDSRLKRSLERIKAVCDDTEKHGGRIYVGRIGKLCQAQFGGPAAQSIRNQPDTLKRYVDLRSAGQTLPGRVGQGENRIKISDPKVRSYVLQLEERVRDSEEQIRVLKRLLGKITPVEIDKIIAAASSSASPLVLTPLSDEAGSEAAGCIRLNDPARRALGKITSESHLKQFRLNLYRGRVVNETMRKFLEKDEFQALLELLAA